MAKKKIDTVPETDPEYTESTQSLENEEQTANSSFPENGATREATEEQAPAGIADKEQHDPLVEAERPSQILSLDTVTPGPETVPSLSRDAQAHLPDTFHLDEAGETQSPLAEPGEVPAPESLQYKDPTLEEPRTPTATRETSDRQSFFDLDFNELDRDLSDDEQKEWNSIYASYRGRSVMTGTIIGVDRHTINVRNQQSGVLEQQEMLCAIVVPYRVRIVIPSPEMWDSGQERPGFVLQHMVGATIDFVIIKIDREAGFALASRRLAAKARRYFFSRRPTLNTPMSRTKCRVLSVGPRRCLVECHGYDINLTQREMRYTAIPDMRTEYHPGDELDCMVKTYDPANNKLTISVKDTKSNPFDGAELRHPTGSRRQAVIAGKYGGGVFCNLPDGTVCMCAYSFQYEDSQFQVGDTVIIIIQRYDIPKKQIYGKIITKW